MWIFLPCFYLAIAHIAGDNVAVVPDMAVNLGQEIYVITILSYLVFGSIIAGVSAWIGVKSRHELVVVVRKLFGSRGKKISALVILAICIPASVLTGGLYSGWITNSLFNIPLSFAIPMCIIFFSLLATGSAHELLKLSNYISLLIVPAILVIFFYHGFSVPDVKWNSGEINWLLVSALVGYNAGGMRSALIVETAAYLAKRGCKTIYLIILAKIIEGTFTLGLVHLIVLAGISGPLAVSNLVSKMSGPIGLYFFNFILLCTFISAMVPAMTVNARQVQILTGLSLKCSLFISAVLVYLGSLLSFAAIIDIMGYAGILTILFILYTAYALHKYGLNHS
ncbi:hypothetical protein V6C17_08280 [Dendrosporobacter sp. 1207_IL3150]